MSALLLAVLGLPSADAAGLTVRRAELSGSSLRVEGSGAVPRSSVVVDGGSASGTADAAGAFRIEKRGFASATCRIGVTDGTSTVSASLAGCTPTSPPPPDPSTVPTPAPVSPAAGASVGQPVTLAWSAGSGTDAEPVVAYHWEVATSSAFTSILLQEATARPAIGVAPPSTDTLSGLPDGTYLWRVRAVQSKAPVGDLVASSWSSPRSLTITGAGSNAPVAPTFTTPTDLAQFHPFETFAIAWSEVAGASAYELELDDEPSFTHPQLTTGTGVVTQASVSKTYGEPVGRQYARVRAVGVDGTRGLPSSARSFTITYTAPVPPAPAPVAPADGTTVGLPVTFDWTSVPNEQPGGYELQIATSTAFTGGCGSVLLCVRSIGPSSFTESSLPAGTLHWRVRSHHGLASPSSDAVTAWSPVRSLVVPDVPPSLSSLRVDVLGGGGTVLRSHTEVYSGSTADNLAYGIVQLAGPAPAGGAVVALTSSDPAVASVPPSITLPAGEATYRFPVDPEQVMAGTTVTLAATFGGRTVEAPLTVLPARLKALDIGAGRPVVPRTSGGTPMVAGALFDGRAPAGSLIDLSSDHTAAQVPASAAVATEGGPAGFTITTSEVAVVTTVTITATWRGRSVSETLTLSPPPSLLSPANGGAVPFGTATVLDWTDVFAQYTVQVSASSSFTAPLQVDQRVWQSQHTVSGLPRGTWSWRVRAHDAYGNPGPWSAVRTLSVT